MSFTQDRVLVHFKIDVQNSAVEIKHSDRMLVDGDVVSEKSHYGSYEMIDGDLPDFIQEDLDLRMSDLCGEALTQFIKENAKLRALVASLENNCELLTSENKLLAAEVLRLEQLIVELTEERNALSESGNVVEE